jgi:ubiquinone/menaquinone biosynthesis C-methylase UbiE
VLGLDVNPDHVRLAGEFAAASELGNARATGLPGSSFDLVYARLLLINIPWPADVVAEMVRLARPGCWVAGEEADAIFICHPPHEAWTGWPGSSGRRGGWRGRTSPWGGR